jgi:hypothetical protein
VQTTLFREVRGKPDAVCSTRPCDPGCRVTALTEVSKLPTCKVLEITDWTDQT